MKQLRTWILPVIALALVLTGCGVFEEADRYPLCRTRWEIERYQGTQVRLIGIYRHVDAGKWWVSEIELEDGTRVVLSYQPPPVEVKRFSGRTITVIGTILSSYPEEEEDRDWLDAPHLRDRGPIQEYVK